MPRAEGGSLLPAVAGAVVWTLHFFVVYLIAEVRCSIAFSGLWGDGRDGLVWFAVGATVAAVAVIAGYALGSLRRWRSGIPEVDEQERMLGKLGLITAATFAIATVSVGVIVVFLPPC